MKKEMDEEGRDIEGARGESPAFIVLEQSPLLRETLSRLRPVLN